MQPPLSAIGIIGDICICSNWAEWTEVMKTPKFSYVGERYDKLIEIDSMSNKYVSTKVPILFINENLQWVLSLILIRG